MAAELSMNGRKKIETIQKEFTNKFNYLTLLFLDEDRKSLDISKSLSEVRKVKGTDISINAGLKVNTLEARFRDNYGLMVEVAYMKDGKVLHTKDNVDKTLNEMNRWCEENGCDKFEFKKSLRGDTVLSLQEQLFNAISEQYPDAVAKKMNKDNFMDVHLPSVNAKKGTHIFFNTAQEGIKFGFYCRDEAFVKSVLDNSSNIEAYAQGVRPLGNPLFAEVDEAAEAALDFLGEMMGEATNHNDENLNDTNNDLYGIQVEDFQLIHTLVTLYSAFASQSGISDSSLDVLVERIQAWELGISDDEKNTEIMKAMRWFSNNYDASLFSKLKIKLNELSALSDNNRKSILEDLRMISNTFFEMPSAKIQFYASIITNLGFNTNEYAIEPVSKEMIDNFNSEFDIEYKSTVLENLREEGYITLFSIDVKDLNKAIEENDFSEEMLHHIGKAELGDWASLENLTSKEEVISIKKDFKDEKSKYIVILYCQGNYIHAFSTPNYDEESEDKTNANNKTNENMATKKSTSSSKKTSSLDSTFKRIKIGKQEWMGENLNVDKFRNGDLIPEVKSQNEWEKAGKSGKPAWCYYDNNNINGEKYGKLYNWYAVNDPRGLAPEGWHIPSDEEWDQLAAYLGGEDDAGKKMKTKTGWDGSEDWPEGNGTDEYGFSGLPGGLRTHIGEFIKLGKYTSWWTSTESDTEGAWDRSLYYAYGNFDRGDNYGGEGLNVRCLKD